MWTIPAPRTKGNREHRVPLSRRALEILEEARALGRVSLLVFPSGRWPTSCRTWSRPFIGARTCSSGGAGGWQAGRATWSASVETRRPRRPLIRPDRDRRSQPSRLN